MEHFIVKHNVSYAVLSVLFEEITQKHIKGLFLPLIKSLVSTTICKQIGLLRLKLNQDVLIAHK